MKHALMLGIAVILLAACGSDAPENASNDSGASETSNVTRSDRSAVVIACKTFETNKVCNCIADVLEQELGSDVFQKVAENARNGASTPSGLQRDLLATERATFDDAMGIINADCELN